MLLLVQDNKNASYASAEYTHQVRRTNPTNCFNKHSLTSNENQLILNHLQRNQQKLIDKGKNT